MAKGRSRKGVSRPLSPPADDGLTAPIGKYSSKGRGSAAKKKATPRRTVTAPPKPRANQTKPLSSGAIFSLLACAVIFTALLGVLLLRSVGDGPASDDVGVDAVETPLDDIDLDLLIEDPTPVPITGVNRDNPFAMGTPTTVEWDGLDQLSVWNATIGEVRNITDDILAASDSAVAPPNGVVYAGFDVEMTLVSARNVPISQGFGFEWEIVGGSTDIVFTEDTITTDDSGCGSFPAEWQNSSEVFIGGTLSGTVCIPLPVRDLEDPTTMVAIGLPDRFFFAPEGTSPEPIETPGPEAVFSDGEEAGTRQTPHQFDDPIPFEVSWPGESDRSDWTVTISAPRDITAEATIANPFTQPIPEGVVLAGFDVSLTLDSATEAPLPAGRTFFFDIVGGETAAVYESRTIRGLGCVPIDEAFSPFDEVPVGETVEGTICIPLPVEDLAHPNTQVSVRFTLERVFFGGNE